MNRPPKGDDYRRLNAHTSMGVVSAMNEPSLNVKISPISFWLNGVDFVEYAGGVSPSITSINANAKWVLICLQVFNEGCLPVIIDGEAKPNNPPFPVPLKNQLPLAAVYMTANATKITNDMIFDVRGIFGIGVYPTEHSELIRRDAIDSHPIGAISNLQDELNSRPKFVDVQTLLDTKADVDGTSANQFVFNKDQTGVPTTDVALVARRGSLPDVGVRWNEQLDRWEFTNDGIHWFELSNAGYHEPANSTVIGLVRLSIDPVDESDPIAVADNDNRLFTEEQKMNIYTHLYDLNDPHAVKASLVASDIPAHEHTGTGQGGVLGVDVVDVAQLKNGAVVTSKLGDSSVEEGKIANEAVTLNKLAPNSVDGSKIVDGSVVASKIPNGIIDNSKLSDNSVSTQKLVDASVVTQKIVDGAVIDTKLGTNAVTNSKVASGAITLDKLGTDVKNKFIFAFDKFIYVAPNGNDTTGDGSVGNPFASLKVATASIKDASATKIYTIFVMPGTYVEDSSFVFGAFINYIGFGKEFTSVGVSNGSGGLKDMTWNILATNTTIKGITITSGLTIGTIIDASSGININFDNAKIAGDFKVTGRNTSANISRDSIFFSNNSSLSKTFVSVATSLTFRDALVNGTSSLTGSANVFLLSSNMLDTLTITGTDTMVTSDSVSYPQKVSLINGAIITMLNYANGVGYTPTVRANWSTNVGTVQQALDQVAATKIGNSIATDFTISFPSKGIVLTSPNGTQYRLMVDDSGVTRMVLV